MSERDNGVGSVVVIVVIMLVILVAWLCADYNDIRDLQRRVGQLESAAKQ